jgi:hypothetical protein
MKYKVHHFNIGMKNDREELERFLNNLKGDVVSVIPKISNTSLSQIFGITNKVDYLLIVEKTFQD